jgi:antitoxin (DNA-binding transcriptional repressor) of toxin-antitoxin stability system
LLVYVDEFLEVPKTVPDRTVGQWRNLRATRHVFFPEEARQWMLFHVFDRAEVMVPLANREPYPNPTRHGAFNDAGVPFWLEAVWKPQNLKFPEPQVDCNNLFTSRLGPAAIEVGAGVARAITIPAEEMARKWQMVWQEIDGGKTVAITSGGETIARIVPVRDQEVLARLPRLDD